MGQFAVATVQLPVNNAPAGAGGILTATTTYTFPSNVFTAIAAVSGFTISFGGDDHDFLAGGASVSVQTQGSPTVTITGTLQLENDDGSYLDPGSCSLTAAIMAWTE